MRKSQGQLCSAFVMCLIAVVSPAWRGGILRLRSDDRLTGTLRDWSGDEANAVS